MVVNSQNESNTTFTSTFDNLIPFSDYTVTVTALTGDNGEIVGEPAMTAFLTDTGGKVTTVSNSKTRSINMNSWCHNYTIMLCVHYHVMLRDLTLFLNSNFSEL